MSAGKITTSRRKLDAWAATRELDRLAKIEAERRGCALIEAYVEAAEQRTAEVIRSAVENATVIIAS